MNLNDKTRAHLVGGLITEYSICNRDLLVTCYGLLVFTSLMDGRRANLTGRIWIAPFQITSSTRTSIRALLRIIAINKQSLVRTGFYRMSFQRCVSRFKIDVKC